jgi:ketosteroid isomerase-like protein
MPDELTGPARQSLESQVRWLLDREQIRAVMMDYCRGVDRRDYDLIRSAYFEDAFDDHGNFTGSREAVVEKVSRDPEGMIVDSSMHHVGNIRIELNGDSAQVESSFVAYSTQLVGDREHLTMRAGRYLDRFECRQGQWGIARRIVADDWSVRSEVLDKPEIGYNKATRDKSDPSYWPNTP